MSQETKQTDLIKVQLELTPDELEKLYQIFLILNNVLGLGKGFLLKMAFELNELHNKPENLKKITALDDQ